VPTSTRNALHVTSADFVRHFGGWQERANKSPIVVTHHGRERLVVLSPERFCELASNDAGHADPHGAATAQERLTELEIVADHVEECFVAFDHDLRIVRVNSGFCAYLRMARCLLEGRTIAEAVPQSRGSLASSNVDSALETGRSTTLEVPSLIYPGRWLRVKTFPFSAGSACLFRDVTDEVEARETVDVHFVTRQAMVTHGMVGRCVLTPRATFREVDAAFAALVGLEPQGMLRARFSDIFPANRRAEAREWVEAVLETGQPSKLDSRLLHRGHAEEDVRLSIAGLSDSQGRGAVVIATRR